MSLRPLDSARHADIPASYEALKRAARRAREVARQTGTLLVIAKMLTPRSLPEIGRRFGGRDHTTVMHAVKQIEKLRATDHELDRDIAQLRRLLDG
jgi:chromosomal replication initiator protein